MFVSGIRKILAELNVGFREICWTRNCKRRSQGLFRLYLFFGSLVGVMNACNQIEFHNYIFGTPFPLCSFPFFLCDDCLAWQFLSASDFESWLIDRKRQNKLSFGIDLAEHIFTIQIRSWNLTATGSRLLVYCIDIVYAKSTYNAFISSKESCLSAPHALSSFRFVDGLAFAQTNFFFLVMHTTR